MATKGDYGSMTVREFGDMARAEGLRAACLIERCEPLRAPSIHED